MVSKSIVPMTFDEIAKFKSVVAESHDGRRSDRYSFVPTRDIILNLDVLGWKVREIKVPKARTMGSRDFGKHMVRFFKPDLAFNDPRTTNVGDMFPEIVIVNSHNGGSRFTAQGGIFTLVCSNGLIISTKSFGEISTMHMGFKGEDAVNLVTEFGVRMNPIANNISKMGGVILTNDSMKDFANKASKIRWEEGIADITQLLNRRREEDKGNDLWTVYNVIQENIIKPDNRFKVGKRTARNLTNAGEDIRINSELWDLAMEYA